MGVSESNLVLRDPPYLSAGDPGPSPGVAIYAQHKHSFDPGTSIEQMLAETPVIDTSVAANGWSDSSGLTNGTPELDRELMSMWLAAPADFM